MGAFGAMFPGRRIRHEAGEAGTAQEWWALGPIDLENGSVTLHRPTPPGPAEAPSGVSEMAGAGSDTPSVADPALPEDPAAAPARPDDLGL